MKLYKNVISVIFFAFAVYILILNFACTCFTSADRFELNFYSGDIFMLNVAALALAVAGAIFSDKFKIAGFAAKHFTAIKIILLALIGIGGVVLTLSCGLGSGVDQLYVQQSVSELRNGINDSFKPLMYMDMCSNQYGFACVSYLISLVAGPLNFTAFRLINVFFLVLLYSELSLVGKQIGLGRTSQLLVILMGVIFLPTTLYVLFIYGNIAGFALSVLAVRLMTDCFISHRKAYGILSCLAMFAACLYKSNYMIFAVGIGIYCLFKALNLKDYKKLIYVPALIMVIWLSSAAPLAVMRNLTGLPLNGGESYMSYVAMGVQDNAQNSAGGFNGFNADSYKALNGDKEAHAEYSTEVYKQIMTDMISDPAYMINFFTRKQLHQWTDPVYKSYWSSQSVPQYDTAQWVYRLLRPDLEYPVVIFFSFFQIAVWSGAILFIWFGRNHEQITEALIMPMIFIGGFIFHTFWEAKSQYVFPFFVILFPVSIIGWKMFSTAFAGRDKTPLKEKIDKLNHSTFTWTFSFTLVAAAVVLVFAEVLGLSSVRMQLSQDRALYKEYLDHGYRQSWNPLDDGTYLLSNGAMDIECEIVNRGDKTIIKEIGSDRYLTAVITGVGTGTLEWEEPDGGKGQLFKLYLTDDNKIIAVHNDEYVFGNSGNELKVYMVPYGTLDWSLPNEGMTWDYQKR